MPKAEGTAKNPGANKNHAKGFEDALENALYTISNSGFTPGDYTVSVQFRAQIHVDSPARVDTYIAVVDTG
jgi:hypothetical protein